MVLNVMCYFFLRHGVYGLLWGSTVGYPRDSLASCKYWDNAQSMLTVHCSIPYCCYVSRLNRWLK